MLSKQHSVNALKEIAQQLYCPSGEQGIKAGKAMDINNIGMTTHAIDALALKSGESVLEIGHGNGGHISTILKIADNLRYFGADISATIITEAEKINAVFMEQGQVSFKLTDGCCLPFEDQKFDKIFTVNTIYFWKDPNAYVKEIKRVLKHSGTFVLCFADQSFMEKLPFTAYGFKLYDQERASNLLMDAGFKIEHSMLNTEQIKSNMGHPVTRSFHVLVARLV